VIIHIRLRKSSLEYLAKCRYKPVMDYKSLINLGYSNIQIWYLRAPIVDSITEWLGALKFCYEGVTLIGPSSIFLKFWADPIRSASAIPTPQNSSIVAYMQHNFYFIYMYRYIHMTSTLVWEKITGKNHQKTREEVAILLRLRKCKAFTFVVRFWAGHTCAAVVHERPVPFLVWKACWRIYVKLEWFWVPFQYGTWGPTFFSSTT